MSSPSTFSGAPAAAVRSSSKPSYLQRIFGAIKKTAARITTVLLGCVHRNLTRAGSTETCADCRAWRDVVDTSSGDPWRSRWRSAASASRGPVPVSEPAADSELSPSLARLIFSREREDALIRLVFAARRLADRHLTHERIRGEQMLVCRECSHFSDLHIAHSPGCSVAAVIQAVAALEGAVTALNGDEAIHAQGEYGEPWTYRVLAPLDATNIYDADGNRVASISKADREAEEWAERLIACVNCCRGYSTEEVASKVSAAKAGAR